MPGARSRKAYKDIYTGMHALGSALAFGNEYGDSLIVGSHPDGVITLDIDVAVVSKVVYAHTLSLR